MIEVSGGSSVASVAGDAVLPASASPSPSTGASAGQFRLVGGTVAATNVVGTVSAAGGAGA